MTATTTDSARVEHEITDVRTELARTDNKAAALLALAATGLSAGLAVIGSGKVDNAALGVAWLAVLCVALGVLLLGLALRPKLAGGYGFMRWAATTSPHELAALMADDPWANRTRDLRSLSLSARTKYRRIQGGIDLLGLSALAAIAAAAINSQ